MTKWINRINSALALSYYALFFFVPLVIFSSTYELFEFNKMWFTFLIALLVFFLWSSKMILLKKFIFRRTPLDIPIALFLISQLISTIISLDPYVSFWGFYSRFNGGFLSTLAYVFLYYGLASNLLGYKKEEIQHKNYKSLKKKIGAFFSNFSIPFSYKLLLVSLVSGFVVVLWAFPSHFGYDPTCLVFRGKLNVDCWTEAFQPTVRIFSTLGQPNWLAAYISILLLPLIALFLKPKEIDDKSNTSQQRTLKSRIQMLGKQRIVLGIFIVLMYMSLVWTRSQSGFLGFWAGLGTFALLLFFINKPKKLNILSILREQTFKLVIIIGALFIFLNIVLGFPIERLNSFTVSGLMAQRSTPEVQSTDTALSELGGTNSGKIRLIVWRGALDIFKHNPLIGSGVETFAYSYYKYRPAAHNMTSEWDYLYNKAHNEYLNYAATTGILGLGSYLLIIGMFLFVVIRFIVRSPKTKLTANPYTLVGVSLIGSYVSILVSNFFGFSVVIVNLFFFLLPLFVFELLGFPKISELHIIDTAKKQIKIINWIGVGIVGFISLYLLIGLARFWTADKHYALGYNLNRLDQYFEATKELVAATKMRPSEPVFQDELAINLGTLALVALQNDEASQAAELATQSKMLSDNVIKNHPNNVSFYKSRTRVLYGLSQINPSYLKDAISSIDKAAQLAPTDAKVIYNKALLYEQGGNRSEAIPILKQSIELKKDYRDAYYALALLYSDEAKEISATDSAKAAQYRTNAKELLQYSLKNIVSDDPDSEDLLKTLQ